MKNIQQEVIDGKLNPYDLLDLWNEPELDREDIESLGWEKNRLNDRYYNPVTKMHMILQVRRVAIFEQDQFGDNPRFDGVINNKSELKRILKQLGI